MKPKKTTKSVIEVVRWGFAFMHGANDLGEIKTCTTMLRERAALERVECVQRGGIVGPLVRIVLPFKPKAKR